MVDSDGEAKKNVRSFNLNNSKLTSQLHQFVNFSPRFSRELSKRAQSQQAKKHSIFDSAAMQAEHSPTDNSIDPDDTPAKPSDSKNTFLSKEHGFSSDKRDTDDELEDTLAQAFYGNFYGKPKLSKTKREQVRKTKETKAENKRIKAMNSNLEELTDKQEKRRGGGGGGKIGTGSDRGEKKGVTSKREGRVISKGVRIGKGNSFDGVTNHITVKTARKKYGVFAPAAKEKNLKGAAESEDGVEGDTREKNSKTKKATQSKAARKTDSEEHSSE